jgi:uncharacterized phage protein (TIGR02218 family)
MGKHLPTGDQAVSRTIPIAVQSAINTGAFAECTLWTITRRDSVVFRFTDWDRDITFESNVYGSAISYSKSADASVAGLAPANADINGVLDSSAITEADLIAGLWDYAEVEVSRVNPFLLSEGAYATTRTHIGQVSTDSPSFTAELLGLAKALDKNVGRVITATCPVTLGDAECAKDLTAFTFTGTIDSVDASGLVLTDAARTEDDDYFKFGKITMTSGLSNGYAMDIEASTGAGLITLFLPLAFGVEAGDTYSIVAGCDKLKATCKDKFSNLVNFRGFPDCPTQEKVVNHA